MVKHFAFLIDIRFTKKTERGKKLLIFLLQNFMMYFWTFISRRTAHTVFDTYSESIKEHRNGFCQTEISSNLGPVSFPEWPVADD